jgi:hypothetical protein
VAGNAQIRFFGQGTDGGVVQVSALTKLRTEPEEEDFPGSCTLVGFPTMSNDHGTTLDPSDDTVDKWVDVRCWEPDGDDEIYREHVVVFMKGLGLKGIKRKHVAYVVARRPQSASYVPGAISTYNSAGGTNRVRRLGTGSYEVTLAGMPLGGAAQVTPMIESARHVCSVASIERSAPPQRVRVRCFDGAGVPADVRFSLSYTG